MEDNLSNRKNDNEIFQSLITETRLIKSKPMLFDLNYSYPLLANK